VVALLSTERKPEMIKLRTIAHQVAYWTLPLGIRKFLKNFAFLRNLARSRLSQQERLILQRNRVLHNRHAGERCFILATGPSIKKQNLKLLQGENCIAVSNFFIHPDFALLKPRYYCIAPYHHPITEKAWHAWMKELDNKTGKSVMFFALRDRKRTGGHGFFVDRQVHYFHAAEANDDKTIATHGIDLTGLILPLYSVTHVALQIALYMGFQQIYLLGCDHSRIFDLNQGIHFYKNEEENALVKYGKPEWNQRDIKLCCQEYFNQWLIYELIRHIANERSIQIYNATPGSLLDVFPGVNYDSLFKTHN